MHKSLFLSALLLLAAAGVVHASSGVFMDAGWAAATCDAWNSNDTLTSELGSSGWAANAGDKGYKVMRVHRTECGEQTATELHIALQDGRAMCKRGRDASDVELSSRVDYAMWAETTRWQEMGAGEYGAMKAMMTGRLKFSGPKGEAMSNMGPFGAFLRLVGEVDADASTCPAS
ncbi:SCP2 sterol-binding domain-containing protein [bacterium]|nr:SCP2 sterol-binding domain-containing protein [bacterium]